MHACAAADLNVGKAQDVSVAPTCAHDRMPRKCENPTLDRTFGRRARQSYRQTCQRLGATECMTCTGLGSRWHHTPEDNHREPHGEDVATSSNLKHMRVAVIAHATRASCTFCYIAGTLHDTCAKFEPRSNKSTRSAHDLPKRHPERAASTIAGALAAARREENAPATAVWRVWP